jgi:hypothetical protein
MPLVSQYKHLKKPWFLPGPATLFFPLRAVGLAVELGYKLCPTKGLDNVSVSDLSTVKVSGKLQIYEEGRWRSSNKCDLKLARMDALLAKKILEKTRGFLIDLGANVWFADVPLPGVVGRTVSFDLLGDFSKQPVGFNFSGRLWVELKVFTASTCQTSMAFAEKALKKRLDVVRSKDATIGGVLLLVASVEKESNNVWGAPKLFARLLTTSSSDSDFINLSTGNRVAQGQVRAKKKPSLAQVFAKMEWHLVRGSRVGLFKHFLEALNLAACNPGRRAAAQNKLLARSRFQGGRLQEKVISNRPGRPAWVATRKVFRALYKYF